MNEAATSHRFPHFASAWLRRDTISRTAITLYTATFFGAAYLGIDGWRLFAAMAFFALVALGVGPRIYRIAGAIALLIAIDAGYFEFRQEQREQREQQRVRRPVTFQFTPNAQ